MLDMQLKKKLSLSNSDYELTNNNNAITETNTVTEVLRMIILVS